MKPRLVLGLGNPLMGDDGIGWHVAEQLAEDPRLPDDTEVAPGGTDLLQCVGAMEGRRRVYLIDAISCPPPADSVFVFEDEELSELDDRQGSAHHLSPVQAIELLRTISPELRRVRFTMIAIPIRSARLQPGLSQELASAVPRIIDCVLGRLASERDPAAGR